MLITSLNAYSDRRLEPSNIRITCTVSVHITVVNPPMIVKNAEINTKITAIRESEKLYPGSKRSVKMMPDLKSAAICLQIYFITRREDFKIQRYKIFLAI